MIGVGKLILILIAVLFVIKVFQTLQIKSYRKKTPDNYKAKKNSKMNTRDFKDAEFEDIEKK